MRYEVEDRIVPLVPYSGYDGKRKLCAVGCQEIGIETAQLGSGSSSPQDDNQVEMLDMAKNMQKHTGVRLIMYADDMTIGGKNIVELQEASTTLENLARQNKLKINKNKTQLMTFRKGRKKGKNDEIKFNGEHIKSVKQYKYLGLTLQVTATTFTAHITEKCTAAIKAIYVIRNLQLLSLETAMKIFHAKICPILLYGIEIIWEKLSKQNLRKIEQVKARYLKLVLGLSKNTQSRLTYELCSGVA